MCRLSVALASQWIVHEVQGLPVQAKEYRGRVTASGDGVPPQLERLIMSCLELEPQRRPSRVETQDCIRQADAPAK
jgi:hypothetical protein